MICNMLIGRNDIGDEGAARQSFSTVKHSSYAVTVLLYSV